MQNESKAIQHAGGAIAQQLGHRPSNTQAVAISDASPFDVDPAQFRAGLERRKENRTALMGWVRDALVDGVDYGTIKFGGRESKPSLWKPGAEKIAGMLNLTASFPNLTRYEDMAIEGKDIDTVILRCEIRNGSGHTIAEGIGSRSVKAEKGDLNKTLKMAAKSAFIDGILRAGGLSEIFTLDIEDMPAQATTTAPQPPERQKPTQTPIKPATEAQNEFIGRLLGSSAINPDERKKVMARMDRGMTAKEASGAIEWLQETIDKRKQAEQPTDEPPELEVEEMTPEQMAELDATLNAIDPDGQLVGSGQ